MVSDLLSNLFSWFRAAIHSIYYSMNGRIQCSEHFFSVFTIIHITLFHYLKTLLSDFKFQNTDLSAGDHQELIDNLPYAVLSNPCSQPLLEVGFDSRQSCVPKSSVVPLPQVLAAERMAVRWFQFP